jgi:hypothetical protein
VERKRTQRFGSVFDVASGIYKIRVVEELKIRQAMHV